jgi:hypothetical protein
VAVSRREYDATRAAACDEGVDVTPCFQDCGIVLVAKTSGAAGGQVLRDALWLLMALVVAWRAFG